MKRGEIKEPYSSAEIDDHVAKNTVIKVAKRDPTFLTAPTNHLPTMSSSTLPQVAGDSWPDITATIEQGLDVITTGITKLRAQTLALKHRSTTNQHREDNDTVLSETTALLSQLQLQFKQILPFLLDLSPAQAHGLLCGAVYIDDQNTLESMLASNVNPDSRETPEYHTALQLASDLGNPRLMRTLLHYKADPDLTGPEGATALHLALRCKDFELRNEMVQGLMEAGASINIADNKGNTPIDIVDLLEAKELMSLFAQHLLRKKFETLTNPSSYALSTLSIKSPLLNISERSSLCQCILSNVDSVYHELDKLPDSGFALGLDLLPADVPLADRLDADLFSGKQFVN